MTRMTHVLVNILQWLGRSLVTLTSSVGEITVLTGAILVKFVTPPYQWRPYVRQMIDIGFLSLPVIGTTCLFAGMVLTLQSYLGFARFSAEGAISRVVVISITRELAPVLCGLLLAGRSGSAMAAEISTMKLNDQLNALRVMRVDLIRFLVAPRVITSLIALPILVAIGDVIGIMGGYALAVGLLGFDGPSYLKSSWDFLTAADVISGLIKAAVFGLLIGLMGCAQGLNAKQDARSVGLATTTAVIYGSMLVLISNFFITALLF